MKYLKVSSLVSILSLTVLTNGALAEAPATGYVVEGYSVPGASIGDSRGTVNASYGDPMYCQTVATIGDEGVCAYAVTGNGQVNIVFASSDAEGSTANGDDNDIASTIRWSEDVTGWMTATGANTSVLKSDPEDIIAAYPDAIVNYSNIYGISKITDHAQGIAFSRSMDFYSGIIHVSMEIFAPTTPPPVTPPTDEGSGKGKGKKGGGKGGKGKK